MKNGYGQEVRWVLEKDMLAYLKEKLTPEKFAEYEAHIKQFHEKYKPKLHEIPVKDSEGRIVSSVTGWVSSHVSMRAEMISDPWTGQPKVFTEEERAEFELTNRGLTPEWRERVASFECNICHRLNGEHSAVEFDDCQAQIEAPTTRFGKGPRAKKERIAHGKCAICSRLYGDHSQQEYDDCTTQRMKRDLNRQQREFRYVKCEICGDRFGDHSPEKYEACIGQIVDNGTFTDV